MNIRFVFYLIRYSHDMYKITTVEYTKHSQSGGLWMTREKQLAIFLQSFPGSLSFAFFSCRRVDAVLWLMFFSAIRCSKAGGWTKESGSLCAETHCSVSGSSNTGTVNVFPILLESILVRNTSDYCSGLMNSFLLSFLIITVCNSCQTGRHLRSSSSPVQWTCDGWWC